MTLEAFLKGTVMNIDFSRVLKDLDGKDLNGGTALREFCVNSLIAENKSKSVDEAVRRYNLAKDIKVAEKELNVEAKDITLIKESIAAAYPPIIAGQVCLMLEGEE